MAAGPRSIADMPPLGLAGDEDATERRLHPEVAAAEDDLAGAVGIEPQPVELPMTVLGSVGQQALRRVAAGPARERQPLILVVAHRTQRYAVRAAPRRAFGP